MNVMKWSNILHVTGVVNEHITSLGEAMKWVLKYFKDTSVTYNGCSDLVYGSNFATGMSKMRSAPSYVSKYHFGRQVIDAGGVV